MKKHFAKQIFAAALAISFVCGLSACREREEEQLTLKPVIYLYPEEKTDISVTLAYDGTLTCTYPNYKTGWHVSAKPDGTLTDEDGQTYNYLGRHGQRGIRSFPRLLRSGQRHRRFPRKCLARPRTHPQRSE